MRKAIEGVMIAFVALFALGSGVAYLAAQDKPAQTAPTAKSAADKEPVLTELQIEKLDNRIRTAQLAGQQADAKAIAAAIVEMIEARQKAAVAAANEANAYFQSLNVEGWTLDVQTKKYTKKKE